MNWGDPGPGQWVTIYANGGHIYMVVAGLRFDTSGRSNHNTRWQTEQRSRGGLHGPPPARSLRTAPRRPPSSALRAGGRPLAGS